MHRVRAVRFVLSYGRYHYGGKRLRVKILPPPGCDRSILDERSWVDMKEGSTVRDALHIIRCNPLKAKILLLSVNGERCRLDRVLHDGDIVGFFFPVSGG